MSTIARRRESPAPGAPSAPAISSLDSLRCFLAAARALSFRRAARTVALTPTAFSQRIKQLEEQVGGQLFARTTRVVSLTELGIAMVPAAERCLDAAGECARVGRGGERARDQAPMDLTLGTRQELGLSWVMPQRRALMRARPWLHVHLYFSSGADLLLRLRTHEIDCAISSTSFADPKLDAFLLHREDYVFVGAPKLLARAPLRRVDDAARHTIVDASADLPLLRYFRESLGVAGGSDRLRFARGTWMGSIAAIRELVLAGEGVAVLPTYFVRKDLAAKRLLRVFPGQALLHDHFRLVFRAADPRRPLFESMARELVKAPLR